MAKLFRASFITSGATFLSRILGLIRDIFIAHLLGAGVSADVFFFANRIPNFLRRLFAEGAFSQAFVPVMTEFREKRTKEELNNFLSETIGTLGVVVFIVTILGMLGSSIITAVLGWGWFMDYIHEAPGGEKFLQASFLLKITFPYLFFITLTAVSGAILNTLGRFAIPAITPCLLNISMIGACVFLSKVFADPNEALAYGVLIGGVLQFLLQIPFLYKLGCLVIPKFSWHSEGVTKIRNLMLPAIFGVSVSQVNLIINTVLASFLSTGAISYLYYSDRLLEFPIGIFAVAIGTVILPALSKVKVNGNEEAYKNTLDWGVKTVLTLGIPAMFGMIMLREPIIRVLFMRGEFSVDAAFHSSLSLIASVLGLWAIMLSRVLIPGFNSRMDIKTPVRYGIITVIANIIFNLILVYPLEYLIFTDNQQPSGYGYIGLALSTALAAFVNVSLLLHGLKQRGFYSITKNTLFFIGKIVLSSIMMSVVLYFVATFILDSIEHAQEATSMEVWSMFNTFESLICLAILIFIGVVGYGVTMLALGVRAKDYRV